MADFVNFPERTSYFGSFYKWTSHGRHQLITKFQANYPDRENVPAISYDPANNVFCMRTNEPLALRLFSQLLKGQIDFDQQNDDHIGEELFVPIEFTTLSKEFENPGQFNDLHDILIDVDDDSDESTGDSSSGGGPCSYWLPRCEDASILTDDIATKIAEITDCFLYKEIEHRRWRVMHGKFETAIEKLQILEPLLEYLAQHRAGTASKVNHNLLSFSCQLPGTGIRYLPVTNSSHRDRVMVHPALEEQLDRMFVGEEKVWDQTASRYLTPDNLLSVQMVDDNFTRPTNIWAGFKMQEIGDQRNSLPRTPSGSNSVTQASAARKPSSNAVGQNTNYLPLQEQVRLQEWSKAVDTGADPAIAAEEPIEPELDEEQSGQTKRIVEDSDSDSEALGRRLVAAQNGQRILFVTSDSESERSSGLFKKGSTRQHQQPIGIQNVNFGHINRAERKTTQPPALPTSKAQTFANLVSAEAFFEGMPRDEDDKDQQAIQWFEEERRHPNVTSQPEFASLQKSYDGSSSFNRTTGVSNEASNQELSDLYNEGVAEFKVYAPSDGFDHTSYDLPSSNGSRQAPYPDDYGFQHNQKRPSRSTGYPLHLASETAKSKISGYRPHIPTPQQSPTKNVRIHSNYISKRPQFHRGNDLPNSSRDLVIAEMDVRKKKAQLVDYEGGRYQPKALARPPGFTAPKYTAQSPKENSHVLDSLSEDVEIQAIRPLKDPLVSSNEDLSVTTSSSSGRFRHSVHDFTPQTKISKPDVAEMGNARLHQLMNSQHNRDKMKEEVTPPPQTPERIKETDEPSTRKYHKTMNLKAPNPGKSRKKQQHNTSQETDAQKRARIAKVKEELHAEATAGNPKGRSTQSETLDKPEKLSDRAQQAARKNPVMASMHASSLQATAQRQCSNELTQLMQPIIEVARAFPGNLTLEIQVGKLLVMPTTRISTGKIYERDKWTNLFQKNDSLIDVVFTNILTNNGADIDGILQTKTKRWTTWSREQPGPSMTTIEFLCLDILGQRFKLILKADGSHETTRDISVISKIGIHCPGRVWDVCTVLSGIASWADPSAEFEQDIEEFVKSIYVRPGSPTTVFFRPPASNGLFVEDVILKRVSLHDCQVPGEGPLQLKITEVKTLITRNHRTDSRLHVSHEAKHDVMAGENRVFYEVSIIHRDIEESLKDNRCIEVGELTEARSVDILSSEKIELMLNAALRLLDKIGWVGSQNYGTLVQRQDAKLMRDEQIARTLPPTARDPTLVRPVHLPTGNSTFNPRTVVRGGVAEGATFSVAPTTQLIHGIRSGTQAEIYQDADGNYFRLGQGGARIPVALDDDLHISKAEILPDDSASQIGRQSRGLKNRNKVGAYPDKPESFW